MSSKPGDEWPFTLDLASLIADGWHPSPFREFIVKIASRCDLSCDYCYVYEMADQSWRQQPRRMSADIADLTAERIAEHVHAHGLRRATLILHGGEPLLAGSKLISHLTTATRKALEPDVSLAVRMQTNGIGLTDEYLRLFDELDIQVGVSLDGGPQQHDTHRTYASGRGSYAAVAAGIHRLRQPGFRRLFGGLLCTIDLSNDPIETYEGLIAFAPPIIDFLLPHGSWDDPPPGRTPGASDTPYADWLIRVFDHWYHEPQTEVRLFRDTMLMLLTGQASGEVMGLAPAQMVVIETDGSIEQVDSLKSAYQGAAHTGLHVTRSPLDAALLHPGIVARQIGIHALAPDCRACPVHQVCGGGMYVHRYRSGRGFANPSVYCPDLMHFIEHVESVLEADIEARQARTS